MELSTAPWCTPGRSRCAALKVNATAIIMAHNHPSGVAEPTATDRNRPQPTAQSRHRDGRDTQARRGTSA